MKKNDVLYLLCFFTACGLLTANVMYNTVNHSKPSLAAQDTPDPGRTETLKKKFQAMGLDLHEGKYWKP